MSEIGQPPMVEQHSRNEIVIDELNRITAEAELVLGGRPEMMARAINGNGVMYSRWVERHVSREEIASVSAIRIGTEKRYHIQAQITRNGLMQLIHYEWPANNPTEQVVIHCERPESQRHLLRPLPGQEHSWRREVRNGFTEKDMKVIDYIIKAINPDRDPT
jgi:hypothetical protein